MLAMIASALFTVTAKKPVYSVVGLLANFIALAITYLTLHAEFLAVMQIVVYSGAILILFVFVIALLSFPALNDEDGAMVALYVRTNGVPDTTCWPVSVQVIVPPVPSPD